MFVGYHLFFFLRHITAVYRNVSSLGYLQSQRPPRFLSCTGAAIREFLTLLASLQARERILSDLTTLLRLYFVKSPDVPAPESVEFGNFYSQVGSQEIFCRP